VTDTSEGRTVKESVSEYIELALPNDANMHGNVLGGKIMHLVDLAGAIAAMRHCRNPVVTAAMDHMEFINPVRIGQLIRLYARVNRAFRTSMEVGVRVVMEDPLSGSRQHVSSAYLTFVSVDSNGRGVPVPPAIPETEEEKLDYAEAGARRDHRLLMRRRS
jgi:acyl-CoA hydrolase